MNLNYRKVRYKNKYYAVVPIVYKSNLLPSVLDWDDFRILKNIKKTWKCSRSGFVSCSHTYNDVTKDVYLHEIVMSIKRKNEGKSKISRPIIHLNRIGLDNRKDNLIYDIPNKDKNKNIKKKKRIIKLPKSSGINPDDIPTYVWYMKPDKTHGERFMIEIGDIKYKTTSSKKLSLQYKLEEAKLFLRQLKKERPELFMEYSMNGDYTKDGIELLNTFYEIIAKAGYDHIQKSFLKNKTTELLKPGIRKGKEKRLLSEQGNLVNLSTNDKRRRVFNNIPKDSGIKSLDLPKHCYYRPAYKNRGDYFVVENHPLQIQSGGNKIWQTSSSKKLTTKEKYKQLVNHLKELNDESYSYSDEESYESQSYDSDSYFTESDESQLSF